VTMVLWKETVFPLCRAIEKRWNGNAVSRVSSVIVVIRLPICQLLLLVAYYYAACNALCVGHKDGESQALTRVAQWVGDETICVPANFPDTKIGVCPWIQKSRRIYIRPRTGPQSAHLWWPAVAKLQTASVPTA